MLGSNIVQVKSLNSLTVLTKILNLGTQDKILKLLHLFYHVLLLCKQQEEVYQDFILRSF